MVWLHCYSTKEHLTFPYLNIFMSRGPTGDLNAIDRTVSIISAVSMCTAYCGIFYEGLIVCKNI